MDKTTDNTIQRKKRKQSAIRALVADSLRNLITEASACGIGASAFLQVYRTDGQWILFYKG